MICSFLFTNTVSNIQSCTRFSFPIMTTDLFRSIYISMRIYTTIIQTNSFTWNSTNEISNALKWALYSSEVWKSIGMILRHYENFQGYHHARQTIYYEEFEKNCQLIRKYISSKDIPIDFIPNAYAYLLHVNSINIFITNTKSILLLGIVLSN